MDELHVDVIAMLAAAGHDNDLDDGPAGPVYLRQSQLDAVPVSDLPVGVEVGLGELIDGVMHVLSPVTVWRERDGTTCVAVTIEVFPKFWTASLNARHYLSLLRRGLQARKERVGDVRELAYETEDDVIIVLSYEVLLADAVSIGEAFSRAAVVHEDVASIAERVVDEADRAHALALEGSEELASSGDIEEMLARVDAGEGDVAARGRALEELIAGLVELIPGFHVSARNLRTETEEIDITVLNASQDPRVSREGASVLIECKNWAARAPRVELSALEAKVRNRGGRCTMAYFISWSGFTADFRQELLRASRDSVTVVPLSGDDIRRAVRSGDVVELFLGGFWRQLHA